MKLTYPMIIHNDSDGIWAEFPDLPGCFTDGDNLTELMENASDAIRCHLTDYVKEEIKIPAASRLENVHFAEPNTCLALATADFDPNQFSRSVKKTLTIPRMAKR